MYDVRCIRPPLLARFDGILSYTNDTEPFGGTQWCCRSSRNTCCTFSAALLHISNNTDSYHMVLVGDVHQIPPICKTPFYTAMITSETDSTTMINPCYVKGVQLFKLFKWFNFEKQERCSSDPIHKKLINDMCNNEGRMTDEMLSQILDKQLKKEDVERYPSHTVESI